MMSVADKLTEIAENVPKVFEAGKKQGDNKHFWDTFQNNGNASGVNYYFKFAYGCWTDDIYNPIHPIVCAKGVTSASSVFYAATITDTKVPIEVLGSKADQMFGSAEKLKTIRKLTVHEGVDVSTTFSWCPALVNLTFGGTIGTSINLQTASGLTVESAKSVILCLKNFTGTGSEFSCTVRFYTSVWTALDAEGNAAPDGSTWKDYVRYTLSWNI